MSLAFSLNPSPSKPNTTTTTTTTTIQTHFLKPKIPCIPIFQTKHSLPRPRILRTHSSHEENSHVTVTEANPRWENVLSSLASLYPVYVTVGGVVACLKPSTFSWFVDKGPASYSYALGFIMLSMGLTLEFKDLVDLFMQRPLSIIFGCAAQYTIMPAFGFVISRLLGLSTSFSVGLILLSCCPGGTASNVVTLIAQGDVPLSIVMTVCSTLGAVLLTPLLTMVLAGTYIHVDALKLSISTLQVVVAPVLLGSYLQSTFPRAVKTALPFAPLLAVLTSSLLACSVFSENIGRLKSSMALSLATDVSPLLYARAFLLSEMGMVVLSVLLLHFAGFFVGYIVAALAGFKEPGRRAISIEIIFGCAAQYTIMPAFGFVISRLLGLSPSFSVGLILLSCCPGGTASNVVTLIAQGDVPLSIVMTVCSTLGAVLLTPLLTMVLAGTYVHVDALKLSISTLQVVVAPVLLGSYLQSTFPGAVKTAIPFAPLLAVLTASLLACSVLSENVGLLKSSMALTSLATDVSPLVYARTFLSSEMGMVVLSVLLLHFAGFFVGYIVAALAGFKEPGRRAVSIEVGMQNSSLGVVLAASHFSSPMVALPPAVSAVIMNIMGSSLGFFWRCVDPSEPEASSKD